MKSANDTGLLSELSDPKIYLQMPLSSLYSPVLMPDSLIISPHLQDSALAHVEEGLTVFQYFSSVLSSEPPKLVPVINLSFVLKKKEYSVVFLITIFLFLLYMNIKENIASLFSLKT